MYLFVMQAKTKMLLDHSQKL